MHEHRGESTDHEHDAVLRESGGVREMCGAYPFVGCCGFSINYFRQKISGKRSGKDLPYTSLGVLLQ